MLFNYFKILFFTILVSTINADIVFNSLNERLVLSLIKVKLYKNVVASELLVRFPLCKLASVATGDARDELMTLLGYKNEEEVSNCYPTVRRFVRSMMMGDLTIFNKLYVNYGSDINATFITNATDRYGVQVDKVGFNYPKAATVFINNAVSFITIKRITDIVDATDINKQTKMIIVNGAHFKGTWEFPFDYRLTRLGDFRHIDGKVSRVPMMTMVNIFSSIATDSCEALSMKFASWMASITFVLPSAPKDFLKLLETIARDKNFVNNLVKNMKSSVKEVFIPQFKIRTFVDWTGFLQELGLYSVFDANSTDLGGILNEDTQDKHFPLSKIKQKVFVQIDEMGIKRHRQGRHDTDNMSNNNMPPPFSNIPKFTVDRPFYFEITLDVDTTRHHLFTGVYYGPEP